MPSLKTTAAAFLTTAGTNRVRQVDGFASVEWKRRSGHCYTPSSSSYVKKVNKADCSPRDIGRTPRVGQSGDGIIAWGGCERWWWSTSKRNCKIKGNPRSTKRRLAGAALTRSTAWCLRLSSSSAGLYLEPGLAIWKWEAIKKSIAQHSVGDQ